MGRTWRRAKAPLEATGAKGAAVIPAVDVEAEASVRGVPVVAAARGGQQKGPTEDGVAVRRTDALVGAAVVVATTRREANGVAVGKIWRPRRPARAPLEAAARCGEKGPLEEGIAVCRRNPLDGAPAVATTPPEAAVVKDANGAAVGRMWRPRRPAKVGVKGAKGVAVIPVDGEVEASRAPVVVAAVGGEKGPLEEGIAVCQMDALDGVPVTTRHEVVGVKDAQGVAVGKMWRLRPPAKAPLEALGVKDADGVAVGKMWRPRGQAKAPLEAVGVKDIKGVAVIPVDRKVETSLIGAPVSVAAWGGEKGPLEEAVAVCPVDTLDVAPVVTMTKQEVLGVKDAKAAAVGKVWRARRPAMVPLQAVGVKDAEGVVVIAVDREVEASGAPVLVATGGGEMGPLDEEITVCQMDALDGAPVVATTWQKAAGLKDAKGVVVGKMRRPRQPAKAPLEALGVKDTEGAAVITVDGRVEASLPGVPVFVAAGGGEKGQLEEGIMVCEVDALDRAPVIAMSQQEALGVKVAEEVAVGKMWRPRRPAKAPLKAVGVKDAHKGAVIPVSRKVEASEAPVVAVTGGSEKGPLDEEIVVCQVDTLDGAPVITITQREALGLKDGEGFAVGKMWLPRRPAKAPLEALEVKDVEGAAVITVDRKVEASIIGAPVFVAAGGGEKASLKEGIAVCQVDALDGASVITMTQQEALRVKDAEGVALIAVDEEVEPLVLGVTVVAADGGGEKVPLEDGFAVCLDGVPVIAMTQQEVLGVKDAEAVAVIDVDGEVEPLVLGVPVVAASGDGEKGSLEDGIAVCRIEAFDGAPVITTDEKEQVSVQGDPVFPAVDQKVDGPLVEGVQTITMEGNGKFEKDEEGIKSLKHYSTAQSILIVGDGDFSFSLALATTFGSGGNLVATSLDSYGLLTIKYGKAESNIRELKRLGATVLHDVDAKTMKLHPYLEMRRFDRIVFNFPHAGFRGREYRLCVIKAHKQLVHGFFANARQLLRPNGEIHLSHKTGHPYDAWDIEQLAYESCLVTIQKVDFSREDYPGYNQKKGDGVTCDESFPLGPCCTYMFCVGDEEQLKQAHGNIKKLKRENRKKLKQKQAHRNRVGSISSSLGDSKFYPGISASDMMWPFDLYPAWPQPHFPPVHLPTAFDHSPFGVAQMEPPVNFYGTSFYQQDMVQPTHQEQPWYQEGSPIEPPWTPQEHQSQQTEYEIYRQLTLSLEDRYMESVEGQAMLETLTPVA